MGFGRGNIQAAKTPPHLVKEIRERYATGLYTYRQLAQDYKKSVVQIGRIIRGESFGDYLYAVRETESREPVIEGQLAPATEDTRRLAEESAQRLQGMLEAAPEKPRPAPEHSAAYPLTDEQPVQRDSTVLSREEFLARLAKTTGRTVEELDALPQADLIKLEQEAKRFENLVREEMEKESVKELRKLAREEARRRLGQKESKRLEEEVRELCGGKG